MIVSNYEILKTSRPCKPELIKRLAQLEHAAKMLREYHVKACKVKKSKIIALAVMYETLAENIQIRLDNKGVKS